MNIFDNFFTKFSYKFPKGYPDMDDPNDVLLLESLISEATNFKFKLAEVTALTKRELEKDATFRGGVKEPRINILIKKIEKDQPLTLVDGSEFTVDNKEEVIQALGNPIPTKGIELKDKDGNIYNLFAQIIDKKNGEVTFDFANDHDKFIQMLINDGKVMLPPYITSKRKIKSRKREIIKNLFLIIDLLNS